MACYLAVPLYSIRYAHLGFEFGSSNDSRVGSEGTPEKAVITFKSFALQKIGGLCG